VKWDLAGGFRRPGCVSIDLKYKPDRLRKKSSSADTIDCAPNLSATKPHRQECLCY